MENKKEQRLIVVEGIDGSGKKTQTELLLHRLQNEGHDVEMFSFPRYGEPSSFFVEKYLRGEYGQVKDISPRKASLFYALDRFDWSAYLKKQLSNGKIILLDRYLVSNLAHQGSKIKNENERRDFFNWVYNLEYGLLGLPRPGMTIVLHVPSEVAYELIGKKEDRAHLKGKKRDIHEGDAEHLRKSEEVYLELAKLYPDDFRLVRCAPGGAIKFLRSKEDIHEEIWNVVRGIFDGGTATLS